MEVYVDDIQFFKHPNNLSLVESRNQDKLEYTKHAQVLGTAIYVFDLNKDSLTIYVEKSTGEMRLQSQFHLLKTSVSTDGDYFFEIFDTGDVGTFRVTKSFEGPLTFIYQSSLSDATYGFFDTDVTIKK